MAVVETVIVPPYWGTSIDGGGTSVAGGNSVVGGVVVPPAGGVVVPPAGGVVVDGVAVPQAATIRDSAIKQLTSHHRSFLFIISPPHLYNYH